MKKIYFFLSLLIAFSINAQIHFKFSQYANELTFSDEKKLLYMQLKETHQVPDTETEAFVNSFILSNTGIRVSLITKEVDELGYTHIRYELKKNELTLFGKQIIAHCKNGKLVSVNGDLSDYGAIDGQFSITEQTALQNAIKKINAKKYKWENKQEENHMREALNQPGFSYYPTGKKVVFNQDGKNLPAWMFNIYAEEPLYRANVFVDANTGKVLQEYNLICTADITGTALTKYSGTQTLTCDQTPTNYRLRETQRGNGIETFNLNNGSNYGAATDFTSSSTSWTTTGVDQAATDAHWGAEKTYDYYWNIHNRNSIDNNGFKLLSYVHYNTNYNNAFWDGQRMTYGDGNGTTFTILTGLDVCGHEVTHGLTSNTSQLIYSNQSGALNESYSDIFGTCIESYAKPSSWDWKIGPEITPSGNGIRNMQNPNQFNHPDTYLGTNYYTGTNDNGGVHTNSGVSNFWFYLLTAGGTGTNDIASSYTVNGLGMTSAARIAFRALTVYYTPSTNFANARILSIQAAKDLFGPCSNEVIQTTNAWYAVGVGAAYSAAAINPDFDANLTSSCVLPANVNFNNTTASGLTYTWYFGDGGTSTATNAAHSYTANGTYHVKLKATGCTTGVDSIIKTAYIVINAPANPTATGASTCQSGSLVLNANAPDNIKWFSNASLTNQVGTGNSYTTSNLTNSTTYYVVNTTTNAPAFGGIASNVNGGNLNNSSHYIIFDVTQAGTLEQVVMYASAAGNATVQMRNSANTVLSSSVVALTAGANTVALNFNLNLGTNYRLGLSANTNLSLYRTNTLVAYPYNIGSVVNLTGSSAGAAFYYWFYNWKVKKADCFSAAVPVTAVINPLPNVGISVASTTVCHSGVLVNMTGTPSGGTFSGTGVTGNTFDPSVGIGTFTVTYNYTDGNSCSNSTNIVFNVSDCTGLDALSILAQQVIVYPNPASDYIVIKNADKSMNYELVDVAGKIILSNQIISNTNEVNLKQYSPGIYFLNIKDENNTVLKSIKVIKE